VTDAVDGFLEQWHLQRPDLDVSPMGVIGRISRASALLDREVARVLTPYDLQPGEFDLLATLRRSGKPFRLTVGDLLRSTMVTSGAVTHRLNRLDLKGLVSRAPDPKNRRSVIVTLSPAGLDVVERAVVEHLANEKRQLAALTSREQHELAKLLRKLLIGIGSDANADPGDLVRVIGR
jgi:DNA-binding MarR family transcriptional regulator